MGIVGRCAACVLSGLVVAVVSPLRGEEAPAFYAQKTIKIIVPYAAGGSYDFYARLLADHLPRHIPGHPTIIVQNVPGGGGMVGVQNMYAREPQDGTSLAFLPRDVATTQMLRPETARYDARRFSWIGSMSSYAGVMFVASRTGVKTADDLRQKEVVVGSWGQGTESYNTPLLLNKLASTKFRIVTGYGGAAEVDLAVDRGEVDSRTASWTFLKAERQSWLKDGYIVTPFQTGVKRHPELPNIPMIAELANDDEGRRIIEFANSDAAMGWNVASTPNVPSDRVAMLRSAFDEAVTDPALLADALKRGLEILPTTGAELVTMVNRTIATPAESLTRLKSIIGAAN